MSRGTRTIAAALLMTASMAGCGGGKTDAERAQESLQAFYAAVADEDAVAICQRLTPAAVRSVEKLALAQRRPRAGCADLVRGQLRGFRARPGAKISVTADREVSEGRRELNAPAFDDLTLAAFTLVRTTSGTDFEVALFTGTELNERLKRSVACSRFRQTTLRLPVPPSSRKRYPAYLRRTADLLDRRRADLQRAYGPVDGGDSLNGVPRALRRAARDIAAGRDAEKAQDRADARLQYLDALVGFAERARSSLQDCGPDPHLSDRAKAFRKAMREPCRRTDRVFGREAGILAGNPGLQEATAALERMRGELRRFIASIRDGALPDVLDDVRDATVRDMRHLEAILRDELRALRPPSLPRLAAIEARVADAAVASDVGIVRLKLRECVTSRSPLTAVGRGSATQA